MSEYMIAGLVGWGLSYALETFPGIAEKWAGAKNRNKQIILYVVCGFVGLAGAAIACGGFDTRAGAVCPSGGLTWQTAYDLFLIGGSAFIGINGAYVTGGIYLRPESKERKLTWATADKAWAEFERVAEVKEVD